MYAFFTNSSSSKKIDNMAYIVAVGIEEGSTEKYKITFELSTVKSSSSESSDDSSKDSNSKNSKSSEESSPYTVYSFFSSPPNGSNAVIRIFIFPPYARL